MGSNSLGGSIPNINNTLGMLESLGFASGLSLPLGIITILINDSHPSTLPWLLKVLSIDLLKVIIPFVC